MNIFSLHLGNQTYALQNTWRSERRKHNTKEHGYYPQQNKVNRNFNAVTSFLQATESWVEPKLPSSFSVTKFFVLCINIINLSILF